MTALLLALLAATEPPGPVSNASPPARRAEVPLVARRRGAVPLGLSLTGGIGAAERIYQGTTAALFTWELGLSVDLSPRVALTAELALKAGAFTTGAEYRFNFSSGQRFVPRLGAGLAVTGASFLGAGVFADVGLEWRLGTAFAFYVAAKYSFTFFSLAPSFGVGEVMHQFRQTAGVMLSL